MNTYEMLTTNNVNSIFAACQVTSLAKTLDYITVGEITEAQTVNFETDLIEKYLPQILSMAEQLPDEFRAPNGHSITQANITRSGDNWTRNMLIVERFVQLGIAAATLRYPESLWKKRTPNKIKVVV